MTRTSLLAAAAVAALTFGVADKATLLESAPLSSSDIVIAADDTAPTGAKSEDNATKSEDNATDKEEDATESAKMGEDEGTQTGATEDKTPGTDTEKVDQPPRSDPATGTDKQ